LVALEHVALEEGSLKMSRDNVPHMGRWVGGSERAARIDVRKLASGQKAIDDFMRMMTGASVLEHLKPKPLKINKEKKG